jgi:hypothetical protein
MPTFPIAELVKCAQRELAMRKNAYPRWVTSGRLNHDKVDREIQLMAAIVENLQTQAEQEKLL